MKEEKTKRQISRKSRGLAILAMGLIPLGLLGIYTYIPGAGENEVVGVCLWVSFAAFMVLAFAHAVDLGLSLALGLIRFLWRPVKASTVNLNELEKDYTWRKVKIAYIVLAIILVAAATGAAYNSSANQPPYFRPSTDDGWTALITGVVIAWLLYRLVLVRLYRYLVKPRGDSQA